MKGILLAGGSGTRLYPATHVVSKQLLPVYDKPLVYYPLSILLFAGLRDILLISTPRDVPQFQALFGDGSQLGIRMSYAVQAAPNGLAEALLIAEDFLAGGPSCLVLGDNILYGESLPSLLNTSKTTNAGATIFGYPVGDPTSYGVVEFDAAGRVLSLEEKPSAPRSRYAVPGIYFYDDSAPVRARTLRPSPRGELEITDLNRTYLADGRLQAVLLGRGVAWLDSGTATDLHQASSFIEVVERRQGLKIACLEEIAYRLGYIGLSDVAALARTMGKSQYGQYLKDLVEAEGT